MKKKIKKEDGGIGKTLITTIKNPDTIDLLSDYSELGLDSILEEGVLKDVPFFGTIIKVFKAGSKIKEGIFVKKMVKFLVELTNTDIKKRVEQIDKIENDPKYKQKVGETLIMIIDRLDHFDKASIVGKLFAAFLGQKIEYDNFQRLSFIIDKVFLGDLLLIKEYPLTQIDPIILNTLGAYGLITREKELGKIYTMERSSDPTKVYFFTSFGKLMLRHGIN